MPWSEYNCSHHRTIPRHYHKDSFLSCVIEGEAEIRDELRGSTLKLRAGSMMLGEAGSVASGWMRAHVLCRPIPAIGVGSLRSLCIVEDPKLREQLDSWDEVRWDEWLQQVRGPLDANRPLEERLVKLLDWLQSQSGRRPTLAELAQQSGWHAHYTQRRFREYFGLTPKEWAEQVRMERALEEYRCGRSGAEVAAELGFADQSHFIRHFRRFFGITPGARVKHVTPN